jgi:hypothetical protein
MKMQGKRNDPVPGDNRGAVRTNDPSHPWLMKSRSHRGTLASWPSAMGSGDFRDYLPCEFYSTGRG